MNVTVRPGEVYILWSPYRPKEVKIGQAEDAVWRSFQLKLGDPSLELYAVLSFLDAHAGEMAMHARYQTTKVDRETFTVGKSVALRELKRLHAVDEALRMRLKAHVTFMVDRGIMVLDKSADTLACDGSAFSTLLAHVPNTRDGRNIKELVSVALSSQPAALAAQKLLTTCGLVPYRTDCVVLLDRSPDSYLERVFKTKSCRKTWREQLSRYAGLSRQGVALSLKSWLDSTEAGPELVHTVAPHFA